MKGIGKEFGLNIGTTSGARGKFIGSNIRSMRWFVYCRCIIALLLRSLSSYICTCKYSLLKY